MSAPFKAILYLWLGLIGCLGLRAGTVTEVLDASSTLKVPLHVKPGGVDALKVSSKTVDFYSDGILGAQIANHPSYGMQLLLKGPTVGEKPNIGCLTNPASGISVSAGWSAFLFNGTAMWSVGRNGLGVGQITGNAVHRKDADDTRITPSIETELNHDGVTWIDNRMPDGTLGHDPTGRFLRFQVGGNNTLSVGKFGVQIGTYTKSQDGVAHSTLTVQGRIESLDGGFKFPDGTVQTSAAQSQSTTPTFDYIVLTPRATAPASPVEGTLYINSVTKQAYWWDGVQWVVAW